MTNKVVEEFLRESNAIEGVYDDDSLDQAREAWLYLIGHKKLTIGVLLKAHKILMLHQALQPDQKGYFRKIPVWIGGREGIHPIRVEDEIKQWILNVNDMVRNGRKESEVFREKMPKIHHVEFEKIHPFVDGNGRMGRMLMNWERLKLGLPILIIHEGLEQQEYYKWFR